MGYCGATNWAQSAHSEHKMRMRYGACAHTLVGKHTSCQPQRMQRMPPECHSGCLQNEHARSRGICSNVAVGMTVYVSHYYSTHCLGEWRVGRCSVLRGRPLVELLLWDFECMRTENKCIKKIQTVYLLAGAVWSSVLSIS